MTSRYEVPSFRLPFLTSLALYGLIAGPPVWHDDVVAQHGPGAFRITVITGVVALVAAAMVALRTPKRVRPLLGHGVWVLLAAVIVLTIVELPRASYLVGAAMLGLMLGDVIVYERDRLIRGREDALEHVSIGYGVASVLLLAAAFAGALGGAFAFVTWTANGFFGSVTPWVVAAWVAAPSYLLGLILFTASWRASVRSRFERADMDESVDVADKVLADR